MTALRLPIAALLVVALSGCGWFRTNMPVRTGPQAEAHVTYAGADASVERMVAGPALPADAAAVCGARDIAAAERAGIAAGLGAPMATNPDASGSRSILFNDGRGTAVMMTTRPGGYDCTWSGAGGSSAWRDGMPIG